MIADATLLAVSVCWLLPAVLWLVVGRRAASSFAATDAELKRSRASRALTKREAVALCSVKSDYELCLRACARNVKMGPFRATSGLVLPYYLNAATSLMDKHVATAFTRMILDVLESWFLGGDPSSPTLVVGVEMAGGVMVGQCAALAALTHAHLLDAFDFVYLRKTRKSSGTMQQLEGPNHITSRTPSSPALRAVFLDDALSSGASLRDAAMLMARDYNVHILGAIYLVDRPVDRAACLRTEAWLARPEVDGAYVVALFDLPMVDALVGEKEAGAARASREPAARPPRPAGRGRRRCGARGE